MNTICVDSSPTLILGRLHFAISEALHVRPYNDFTFPSLLASNPVSFKSFDLREKYNLVGLVYNKRLNKCLGYKIEPNRTKFDVARRPKKQGYVPISWQLLAKGPFRFERDGYIRTTVKVLAIEIFPALLQRVIEKAN